jgi:CRP-like cAMP-binding protein
MLIKLGSRRALDPDDRKALLALPHTLKSLKANEFLVREDDVPTHACVLLSGYAIRHKIAGNGGRQIFSIHMKGDVVDLQNVILQRADCNVETLTDVDVALIPLHAISHIAATRPLIGQAMWHEASVDAAINREWMLSIGRRDSRARIAHLLCEFSVRLSNGESKNNLRYEFPMTQEQIADALGLTSIHVNKMLKVLEKDGIIDRVRRKVRILEFEILARIADFDQKYLYI